MSSGANSSQGRAEGAEATVDKTRPTEAKQANTPKQKLSQDAKRVMASAKEVSKGAGDQQIRLSSSPPVLCDAPPHVRKSLDAALKAVADRASTPKAPGADFPSEQAAPAASTQTPGQKGSATQLTDVLLAKLITTLSDSALGNPALLLQTLLGFSPEDYNDLLAALSESGCSYVDIIAAYLHNIRVMSEDSCSTSAALSGTLTRSLIEQYNGLLAQALRTSRNGVSQAGMGGSGDELRGQGTQDVMLAQANKGMTNGTMAPVGGRPAVGPGGRRSLDNAITRGPSGLGFGRRSLDSARSWPPVMPEPQAQEVRRGRTTPGTHGQLAADALHQKRAASIDLGQMLSGGKAVSPTIASAPYINPMLLQPQLLAGHAPGQLASCMENMHLQQQAHTYACPGLTLPMPPDAASHLGALNPAMGMMAPTMPTLQAGFMPSGGPVPVSTAQVLAGHGLMPQWPHQGGINGMNDINGVNGQTPLSQLHLMQQVGTVPQGCEHLSTIDENGGIAITTDQVAALAAAAARPAMPMGSMVTQGFPAQVLNRSTTDGFTGINA